MTIISYYFSEYKTMSFDFHLTARKNCFIMVSETEGSGMIKLFDINEENFFAVRALSVGDGQKGFLDDAVGIIARG